MGKTTLLFHLLHKLQGTAKTAFIFQTQCTSHELLRQLLSEFECDTNITDPVRISQELKSLLLAEANAGRRCVLIVDEAQNLGPEVLETIRLLSNFETPRRKLLNIILSGQGELGEMLASGGLRQLRQRLSCITYLQRFTPGETALYIAHRLAAAGYPGKVSELFSLHALTRIAQLSEGVPRVINNICFNALSLGYALEASQIDSGMIEEVAGDLGLSGRRRPISSELVKLDTASAAGQLVGEARVSSEQEVSDALAAVSAACAHVEPESVSSPLPEVAATALSPLSLDTHSSETHSSDTNISDPKSKERFGKSAEKVVAVINDVRKWPEEISARLLNFRGSAGARSETTAPSAMETPGVTSKQSPGPSSVSLDGEPKRGSTKLFVTGGSACFLALCLLPAMHFSQRVSAGAMAKPSITNATTRQADESAPNAEPRLMAVAVPTTNPNAQPASEQESTTGSEAASNRSSTILNRIEQSRQGKKMLVDLALASFAPEPLLEPSPLPSMPVAARSSFNDRPNAVAPALSTPQTSSAVKRRTRPLAYSPPRAIWQPAPLYPANATRRDPGTDDVQLLLSISRSGEVEKVDVLNGSRSLAAAAVETVKTWKYSPALSNGNPVESQAYITVQFQPR